MQLRERKKRDTRQALAEAAVGLGLTEGFDAVTVDRITEAAGVSRRTFFRYFDSKEAAFFADEHARLARFREALASGQAGESAYYVVRRCLLELAAEYDANRAHMTGRHAVVEASRALLSHDLLLDRRFEDAIVESLASTADPVDARVLGSAMFGVVRAVLRPWFEDGDCPSLVALGTAALAELEGGFRRGRGLDTPPDDGVKPEWRTPLVDTGPADGQMERVVTCDDS
jgi:AcrR family transcriptional regulator